MAQLLLGLEGLAVESSCALSSVTRSSATLCSSLSRRASSSALRTCSFSAASRLCALPSSPTAARSRRFLVFETLCQLIERGLQPRQLDRAGPARFLRGLRGLARRLRATANSQAMHSSGDHAATTAMIAVMADIRAPQISYTYVSTYLQARYAYNEACASRGTCRRSPGPKPTGLRRFRAPAARRASAARAGRRAARPAAQRA